MKLRALTLGALASVVALVGCLAHDGSAYAQTQDRALNFANDQRLEEHWRKHGLNRSEFNPVLTKDQYLKRARDFFASEEKELLYRSNDIGDALRYRPSTNEFGVLSSRGVIRTYFRPDSGMRYWERQ